MTAEKDSGKSVNTFLMDSPLYNVSRDTKEQLNIQRDKEWTERDEETKEESDEDKEEGKAPLPLDGWDVSLTPDQEEEIIGPEKFTRCGIGWLTSNWLNRLARPEVYLLLFSLAESTHRMFHAYANGTISTVEKRFKLPSTVSGFINTGGDMVQLCLSLHLSFIAGNGHRPRWLGGALLLAAGGGFLAIIPHLIFGAGDYSGFATEHLNANDTSEDSKDWAYCGRGTEDEVDCSGESSTMGIEQYTVVILLFVGQAMSALANICVYGVGYSYLDEAVGKDKVPLYFAISGCMRIFGSPAGMALSGYFLERWVELGVEPVIVPSHPQWIGAWWLGYPVIIFMMTLASVPMMMMPRVLPGARERSLTRLRAAVKQGEEALEAYKLSLRPLKRPGFKDMLSALRRMSRNKILVTITLNQTCFWFIMVGYWMFYLKYLEHQFKIPAAKANKSMALGSIFASFVGWLGMGSILTFLKPSSRAIIVITMFTTLSCMAAYLIQITFVCERDHVTGLADVLKMHDPLKLQHSSINDEIVSSCMENCKCPPHYSPVCGDKTHLFFSACHAGCKQQINTNGSLMFRDCTCAEQLVISEEEVTAEVQSGLCVTGCDYFIYYAVVYVIAHIFIHAHRAVVNIIFFRSVDERDKDLALGALNVILSITFIFNPLMIGSLVDYSCMLWHRICGRRGFCYLYDLTRYKWVLHGIPGFGLILVFLTEILLLKWSKEIDFFGEKEKENLQVFGFLRNINKKKGKDEDTEL